jgi:hypothetical protein
MRTTLYQWSRRNSLAVVATILLIAGGILSFVVGARAHDDTWKTVGGIVLGSGLTVIVGTLTGREAVHQQYVKEANLRRKTDSYGPLHEEMKALREALDTAHAGRAPYPRRIAVDPTATLPSMDIMGTLDRDDPCLRAWSDFKGNYHADDFSPAAHAILDRAQDAARRYNAAVDAAVNATVAALKPHIEAAIEGIVASSTYQHAREELVRRRAEPPPAGVFYPPDRSWVAWLADDLLRPGESIDSLADTLARSWATFWPTPAAEMPTVGWLLAGQPDRATSSIEATFRSVISASDPPPSGWVAGIIAAVMADVATVAAFQDARAVFNRLHADVRQGEHALERGLQIIRDRYEGGAPLV